MSSMQDVPAAAHEVSYEIDGFDPEPFTIWIHSNDATLTPSPEAYVAATLLPAMKKQVPLQPHASLDPVFAKNLRTIQDIYATWYDEADYVEVVSEGKEPTRSSSQGLTATFFSGGVDSFYTLLKHQDEIDALVYVHGFDVKLDDMPLRRQVSEMLHAVGRHFGKEVIELETNLRDFSDRNVSWPKYYGAALACMGHVLKRRLQKIFIPAAQTYRHLFPEGAHPLLDPYWGSPGLSFVHDGCEATRVDKTARVASNGVALSHLRVCWRNIDGSYNCGKCEKCQRTMVNLLAVEALNQCDVFDGDLDLDKIASLNLTTLPKRVLMEQNLEALEEAGRAPDVQ